MQEPPVEQRLTIASQATAPRRARDFVAAVCRFWHAERFIEPGSLVVSELVSNAVVHTGTEVGVKLRLMGGRMLVSVHDEGCGTPVLTRARPHGGGGHGLDIVSRIAQDWGVSPDLHGGKDVWCVLDGDA